MKRSTSRNLTLIGIGIIILGVIVSVVAGLVAAAATTTDPTTGQATVSNGGAAGFGILGLLAVILMFGGGITVTVGWVGALVKTAQLQRWGWFICLLLLHGGALLVYIFAGPDTPAIAAQGQQPYYPQSGPYPPNQPSYPPSNQPSYPPSNQPPYPQSGPYPQQ